MKNLKKKLISLLMSSWTTKKDWSDSWARARAQKIKLNELELVYALYTYIQIYLYDKITAQ